jgi:hypothetical protein
MKLVFGLGASGRNECHDGRFRAVSKRLFTTREAAERYTPEFTDRCCDPAKIECAIRDTLNVHVIEYELE